MAHASVTATAGLPMASTADVRMLATGGAGILIHPTYIPSANYPHMSLNP